MSYIVSRYDAELNCIDWREYTTNKAAYWQFYEWAAKGFICDIWVRVQYGPGRCIVSHKHPNHKPAQ